VKLLIRLLKSLGIGALLVAGLAAGWAGYLRLSGNIHEVEKDKFYRSAQLSGEQLKQLINSRGIRTVINLRGENKSSRWYDQEVAAVGTTGARYVNFAMSSSRELTDKQLEELQGILNSVQQPFLVHCEAGADRTGLVSAIYQFAISKKSIDSASAQLSFRYGHFPWLRSRTSAMDRTLDRFLRRAAATENEHD
jgi:protein tyrosine/serine phosphatase